MMFYVILALACIGGAVVVTSLGLGLCILIDKCILKGWRPRKHWHMNKNTYEWLGKWGA